MTLLSSEELNTEVRMFEAFGETISDDAAATIASYWYSAFTPQLNILATHVNPFAEPTFGVAELESEARLEQRLMMADRGLSDRDKACYTRQFEALYAWIGSQKLHVVR